MQALIRSASKDVLQHLLFRGRFVWRLPRGSRALALTFDDGPHPEHTPAMLDMLDRAGVLGTFFVVGQQVERHPAVARRIVEAGHAIAGHGYDHRVITGLAPAELVADLQHCRDAIAQATGVQTQLFRPPRGEVSLPSIRTVCSAGFTLVHWTKTFGDYRQDGTRALLDRIEALPPSAGDVLLFHDHNPYSVEALQSKLPLWQALGLRFDVLKGNGRVENGRARPLAS